MQDDAAAMVGLGQLYRDSGGRYRRSHEPFRSAAGDVRDRVEGGSMMISNLSNSDEGPGRSPRAIRRALLIVNDALAV